MYSYSILYMLKIFSLIGRLEYLVYVFTCFLAPLRRVSWDSPVIPFIETFILLLGRIVALRLFCGTWNGIMISVDNLFTVISFSLSGT